MAYKIPVNKVKTKAEAREIATNWQHKFSQRRMSYSELANDQQYFETLGKKFGLKKEFKENGIL